MGFQFCPHCGGKLPSEENTERTTERQAKSETTPPPRVYDGVKYWRTVIERSQLNRHQPLDVSRAVKLIFDQARGRADFDGIVHLLMDRDVVPTGGVFQRAAEMLSDSKITTYGPDQEEKERFLRQRGYVINDGKVVMVNDVAVGRSYLLLEEWGGQEHFGDWNMTKPIDLQPSRSGNPYFFDENMITFGVHFSRIDDIEPALNALLARFKSEEVGSPVDIGVFWQ